MSVILEELDVNSAVGTHLFDDSHWLNVLQKTYDFTFYRVIFRKGSKQLVFAHVTLPYGEKMISLPFSDYVNTDGVQVDELVEVKKMLQQNFPKAKLIFKTTLKEEHNLSKIGEISRKAVYHRVDLNNHLNCSSSFKRGVKKAKKTGVTIKFTNEAESLKRFYTLYAKLRLEKFNSIPQAFSFFLHIFEEFVKKNKGWMVEARYEDKVVASAIVLASGDGWYYKFGASALDQLEVRPNNLLFHMIIQKAQQEDVAFLDLGLSGSSTAYEGLRRFKASMGGEENPIHYITHTPEEYDQEAETNFSKRLGEITSGIIAKSPTPRELSKYAETLYPYFV
ncbi:hypothetical protein GCM10009117_04700 [Gangjinia marincola]|uniref:BioF2-like acetyltransferase domain-containing protein n=1 Tax=Gangjinia marincola TaxID=578463 RepID=A0ABN1ME15_9FLAO